MPSNKQTFQPLFTFWLALLLLFIVSIAQAAQVDKLLEQAEKGSAKAQTDLGVVYKLGKGVQKAVKNINEKIYNQYWKYK